MARARALLAGLWAGLLVGVGLLAAPAAFASLPAADAGRVAATLFQREAYASLVMAIVFVLLERAESQRQFAEGPDRPSPLGGNTLLALGALFCTIAGAFGLQPMLAAARSGQGNWTFAQLHLASVALYGLKTVLVLTLAWRVSAPRRPSS